MQFKPSILAVTLIALTGVAQAEHGRDGHVDLLYWQAPSILNPYLSAGSKDIQAASLALEPLGRYDPDGALLPWLAEAIPTLANGGISADLTTITWRLKPDLLWSDGTPLTAQDVAFTARYCMHPDGGCAQLAKFDGVKSVDAVDAHTVIITFTAPRPNPYGPFTGAESPILQQAQFADCLGERAPQCTEANFAPLGTGPFKVDAFRPNDVISMSANPNYRDPAKPAFATLTFKGGGDAMGAARAVLETGEVDYAWNLQLPPDVLARMAKAGKGTPVAGFGSIAERLELNLTDPSPALDKGIRSTRKAPHPILSDVAVRKALSMAIDRRILSEVGYGKAGRPTCNLVPGPAAYASDNTDCLPPDIAGANALLDQAGWLRGPDGIRTKNSTRLSLLFQSPVNPVRQDFQVLIKHWWSDIGVETELRTIDPSVFFGSDPGSPDTMQKFYADVEIYANYFTGTDPQDYLANYRCGKEPSPANQWQGSNINRYCDPAYDQLIDEMATAAAPAMRQTLAKKMNDMLTRESHTILPLIDRALVSGHANTLGGVRMNTWDSELWNAADWVRLH